MKPLIGAIIGAVIAITVLIIWWPNEHYSWMWIPIALTAWVGASVGHAART